MTDRPGRRDRGSVSVLVVVMVPALLAAAGLVLDGGRQLHARRDAQGAAQAAARAALQPSEDEVLHDQIDVDQAIGRAQSELARHGASGGATLAGDTLVVTVVADVDYLILPGGASVTESAEVVLQEGIDDGQ